jgi:hypothetical protein
MMTQVARARGWILASAALAACAAPPPEAPPPASAAAAPVGVDEHLRATLAERSAGATAVAVVRPARLASLAARLGAPFAAPRGLDPASPVVVALGVLPAPGLAEALRVGAWSGAGAPPPGPRHVAWLPAADARALTRDLEGRLDALGFAPTPGGRWVHAAGWAVVLDGDAGEVRVTAFSPGDAGDEAEAPSAAPPSAPVTPALRAALRPDAAVAIYARVGALERLARWAAFRAAWAEAPDGEARVAFLAEAAGGIAAAPQPHAEIADVALTAGLDGGAPALDVVATLTPFGDEVFAAARAGAGAPLPATGSARAALRVTLAAGPLVARTVAAPADLAGALRHPAAVVRGLLGRRDRPAAATFALRPPSAAAPGLGARPVFALATGAGFVFGEGGASGFGDRPEALPADALALLDVSPSRLGARGLPDLRGVLRHESGALVLRVGLGVPAPLGLDDPPAPAPAPGPEGAACVERLRLRLGTAWRLDVPRRAEALRRLADEAAPDLDCLDADPALTGAAVRAELALMAAEQLALAWRPDAARDVLRDACARDGGRACRAAGDAAEVRPPVVPVVCAAGRPAIARRVRLGPFGPPAGDPGPAGAVVGLAADAAVPYARLREAVDALRRGGAAAVFALVRDAAGRAHVVGPLLTAGAPGAHVARLDDDRLSLALGGRPRLARGPLCGAPGCADAAALPLGAVRGLTLEADPDAPWSAVAQVAGAACHGVALAPPRRPPRGVAAPPP